MQSKKAFILSILAVLCPVVSVIVMCCVEKELAEAVISGLLIGCVPGSISGISALILNKSKNTLIKVMAAIPICPLALFAALAIPYVFYK